MHPIITLMESTSTLGPGELGIAGALAVLIVTVAGVLKDLSTAWIRTAMAQRRNAKEGRQDPLDALMLAVEQLATAEKRRAHAAARNSGKLSEVHKATLAYDRDGKPQKRGCDPGGCAAALAGTTEASPTL